MAGRHTEDTLSKVAPIAAIVVLVLLVVGGISAVVVGKVDDKAEPAANHPAAVAACSPGKVTLAVSPDLADTVREVVDASHCTAIKVSATPASTVLGQLAGASNAPDLWVPDSSSWVARATGPRTLRTASRSLAASPVVAVRRSGKAPASWIGVLTEAGFIPGNPTTGTTSAVPLVGASQEASRSGVSDQQVAEDVVPVAQAYAGGKGVADDVKRATAVRSDGGSAVVSEQTALSVGGLSMTAPTTGTLVLDYPLVVTADTADTADATAAAAWLTKTMQQPAGRSALAHAGFRAPDDTPLTGRGAGPVTPLAGAGPRAIASALKTWARLSRPTRSLAVFDVSGSMGYKSDGQTRMDLTTSAAQAGIGLFPDSAALGVWRFAQHLNGSADYESVLPVRRLSAKVHGGDTQRTALASALDGLDFGVGSGTGLYDTTLAAYKEALSTYDPKAVNSVIIFTDGQNDDPGSISLSDLVSELKKLASASRPVTITTIGISEDADVDALKEISDATGGGSFVARNPQDIGAVFKEALSDRPVAR